LNEHIIKGLFAVFGVFIGAMLKIISEKKARINSGIFSDVHGVRFGKLQEWIDHARLCTMKLEESDSDEENATILGKFDMECRECYSEIQGLDFWTHSGLINDFNEIHLHIKKTQNADSISFTKLKISRMNFAIEWWRTVLVSDPSPSLLKVAWSRVFLRFRLRRVK